MSTNIEQYTNQPSGSGGDTGSVSGAFSDEEAARLWVEFLGGANLRGMAAFDHLYSHFLPAVFRYCRSRLNDVHLAEDVANTVFVRLLESRPILQSSFVGLLFGTARNLCATELSTRHRVRAPELDQPNSIDAEPDSELERRDTHAALADCLDRLPESDQTLVLLRHGEGLTHAHISEILGLRVAFSTLTRRLRAIEAKLRRCLKEKNFF